MVFAWCALVLALSLVPGRAPGMGYLCAVAVQLAPTLILAAVVRSAARAHGASGGALTSALGAAVLLWWLSGIAGAGIVVADPGPAYISAVLISCVESLLPFLAVISAASVAFSLIWHWLPAHLETTVPAVRSVFLLLIAAAATPSWIAWAQSCHAPDHVVARCLQMAPLMGVQITSCGAAEAETGQGN